MNSLWRSFLLAATVACCVTFRISAQQAPLQLASPEQITNDFKSVPCNNADRLEAVRKLFGSLGAPAEQITLQKFKNAENLVIQALSPSTETVIVGAHYDKVDQGCGAVDNWTGIVAIAHLYATTQSLVHKKAIIFVAFGNEEKGLLGSRAMADAIPKAQRTQYCAMINIDSLGMGAPQVAENLSSEKLHKLATSVAKTMKIPYGDAPIGGAGADSASFMEKGIPAITIHGVTNDWRQVLHTSADQAVKVNPKSVYLGYRFALSLLASVDNAPCKAFR